MWRENLNTFLQLQHENSHENPPKPGLGRLGDCRDRWPPRAVMNDEIGRYQVLSVLTLEMRVNMYGHKNTWHGKLKVTAAYNNLFWAG